MHTRAHTHTHARIHTHTHTRARAHTHTRTHAYIMSAARGGDVPLPIEYDDEVFDLAFHPTAPVVATALISGNVHLHTYSPDGSEDQGVLRHHTESCRAVRFSQDGAILFTGSADKSVQAVDTSTGSVIYAQREAHPGGINALLHVPEMSLVATGCDNGLVKLWDLRAGTCAQEFVGHEDFVSDITCVPHKKTFLATSGDGTLSVMDAKKGGRQQSDQLEDELLSLCVMKGGRKVVCGTQDGVLAIYNWGMWEDYTDRLADHPKSVDCLCKLDEDLLCTASSDGLVRVVRIHPNRVLGVLGEHGEYPIERIRATGDGAYLGSCSHDKTVRFWDLSAVADIAAGNGEQQHEAQEQTYQRDESGGSSADEVAGVSAAVSGTGATGGFFDDL